ncbi:MAG: polysaccharide biosynthesis protein [bacterium]|nr:polysaccharide biosynthesis protein [bacterium]
MRILLTGGSGFVGSSVAEFLEKKGIPFVLYDRKHPRDIPDDVDMVVHCAGATPYSSSKKGLPTAELFHEANVEGTKKFLHALEGHKGIKRFVQLGSAAEYGFGTRPFSETTKEKPANAYGRSKLEQSALIKAFAKKNKIKTFNLRVFNVIGIPKKSKSDISRRLTLFEALLAQFGPAFKGEISVNNKNDTRDFVALEDLIHATFEALQTKKGGIYEVINIGSGRGATLGEVARIFGHQVNREYKIVNQSPKVTRSVANVEKAKRILGWSATTTLEDSVRAVVGAKKRVIIIGAGVAGEMLVAEITKEGRSDIIAIGFVDDDKKKQGTMVRGLRVLGSVDDLPDIVKEKAIDQALISTPSVGKELVARVARLLPHHISIKVLPSVSSIILGKVDLSYVRDIDPSDLIGRPLVKADQELISRKSKGKTFLVVGGAGSIGSEIVRQLYDTKAKKIIVLDSWEEGVFNLTEELHAAGSKDRPQVRMYIGNIRDKGRIEEVLKTHKVDVVVHAAAYKHVPLMEENPGEAYKTNYEGTKNLLELAEKCTIKDFVLISSDKAVRPSSVMGATKRKAELLVQEYAKKNPNRRFCAVRFGNVLNSSGSVLPIFLKQISARSPLTITHAEMTRYFMSIPEAVSLVLLSWIVAKNGQILLLDMGEPIKILDFAINLIRIHGLEPYTDIPIVITGIRPGEKMHEELAYDKNKLRRSTLPRIYIAEELSTI